jgi:hypothetical protein
MPVIASLLTGLIVAGGITPSKPVRATRQA